MSMSQEGASPNKKNVTLQQSRESRPAWVAPSFDFGMAPPESPAVRKPPAKRQKRCQDESMLARTAVRNATAASSRLNSKLSWVDKYAPLTSSDLAVHQKKVDDVYAWLETALKQNNKAPMVILKGPPGSGKTATVKVAAREMKFLLKEWITPINSNQVTEDFDGNKKFESTYRSEYDLVRDFLLRASRFPSVLLGEQEYQKRVVLMEDLPHTFQRDPGLLHELLWEYAEDGRSPLVMIIGDDQVFRKLHIESIISQLNIKVIEFNPVAMTIMIKLLQKIAQQEAQNISNKTFQNPTADVINSIYESSCGDLRSAINTLQFACLRGGPNTVRAVTGKTQGSPKKSKKARPTAVSKETELAAIGGRDAPDDFFRVIGRVLYAKRVPQNGCSEERGVLVHAPQDIVSSFSGSGETFIGFLHENYLKHFGNNMKAVEKAANYLSLADVIMNHGMKNDRDLFKQLGLSVAVQSIMYTHPDKSTSSGSMGFRPHHKSRCAAADQAYNERRDQARQLFPHSYCTNYELLTELVPYISIIGPTAYHTEAQMNFIEDSRLDRFGGPSLRVPIQARNTTGPPNGLTRRSEDDTVIIEEFPDSD